MQITINKSEPIVVNFNTSRELDFHHYSDIVLVDGTKNVIDEVLSVPLNLTGFTATFKCYKQPSSTIVLDLSNRLSITALAGIVTLSILPEDTGSLTFIGNRLETYYRLMISNGSNTFRTFEGQLVIVK